MDRGSISGRERLDKVFEGFHKEGLDACSQRWRAHFDHITSAPDRIVLFGTGQFGRLTLQRLRDSGAEPLCFSDNNTTRWGTTVEGLDVLSPSEAVARYGSNATFVVTVFNGSAVRAQLRQMGCKYVASAAAVFWKYPQAFMPDLGIDTPELLVRSESEIRDCFELLADESSRHELCDQIEWRYWQKPEFLPRQEAPEDLYFPKDLVAPIAKEVFVDCGAFDGDCIRAIARHNEDFEHYYALEPDPTNRQNLETFLAGLSSSVRKRITVKPYAVSNLDGTATFTGSGDVSSKLGSSDVGTVVECRRLDSLSWDWTPTYIKMDIEGAEPDAILGAAQLLKEAKPVLAICLYHRSEHLWELPALIHSIQPEFSLFLRRHAEDCWEQVCYAIPNHRVAAL